MYENGHVVLMLFKDTVCSLSHVCVLFAFIPLSFLLSAVFTSVHISFSFWCMHSWSWQSCPGNLWFTDPLMMCRFDFPFYLQRILTVQGNIEAHLRVFDHGGKPLNMWCILIDWMDVPFSTQSPIQSYGFWSCRLWPPHLLTPFVPKNFRLLVFLKCFSTPRFLWES